jgi:hypothetical protein
MSRLKAPYWSKIIGLAWRAPLVARRGKSGGRKAD